MSEIKECSLEHAEVRVENDLVFVRLHGSLQPEQVAQLTGILKQLQEQHDKLFILVDQREAEGLSPVMRRTISQAMGALHPAAIGVYGDTLEQRGAHALLMGAVTGVSGRRPNAAYFQSEKEAREWLLAEHQRLLGS